MAVIFTKNYLDTDLLSTGNSWVIKFASDSATAPNYARVSFLGETFNIDPDLNGDFTFDFYTAISNKVNANNFNDQQNDVDISTESSALLNDGTTYLKINVSISVFIPNLQTQIYSQEYRFKTSVLDEEVHELGFKNIDSVVDVLLPVVDGEFYTQGTDTQPLDFSFYSQGSRSIQMYNLTNDTSKNVSVLEGITRVFFRDGRGNSIGGLTLEEGANRIRLTVAGIADPLYVNVLIKSAGCTSVLKWLNLEGGFGYHVFQHKTEDYSSKTRDFIENDYATFDAYESSTSSTGVDMITLIGFTSIRVTSTELPSLEGLISSPKVYQLLTKSDGLPLWKERVFKKGEMRLKQTGKNVFDFEIEAFKTKKGYRL
jgi:hypothetical protein